MANNCFSGPLDRFCRRAQGCGCYNRPEQPPCRPVYQPEACRRVSYWPCWNSGELIEQSRPRPCCQRCGCCDRLERQGRFVRCCACGWIGFFDECIAVCTLRSCCDTLLWPCRPGEPR